MNIFFKFIKNRLIFFFKIIFIFFLLQSKSNAYLDPGTGSFLLQLLVGLIASVGATLTFYWRKVKNFSKKIFKKKDHKDLSNKK